MKSTDNSSTASPAQSGRAKLSISQAVLLLSLGPLLVVSAVSTWLMLSTTTEIIRRDVTRLASTSADKLVADINTALAKYYEKVANLANTSALIDEPAILQSVATALIQDLNEGFSLYYATATSRFEEGGFYIDSSNWVPPDDWDPSQRQWYRNAHANPNRIVMTDPYVDSMTGTLCVTIAHTSIGASNQLNGVAATDLFLDDLTRMTTDRKVSQNSWCYLVEDGGLYLTNPDASKVMKGNLFDDHEFLRQHRAEFLDGGSRAALDGGRYYAAAPVAGTPWFVVAMGDVSDFTAEATRSARIMLAVMAAQLVALAVAVLAFSRLVRRTFRSMEGHCGRFAQGDFTASFGSPFIREADALERGFETFSHNIRALVGRIFESTSSVSSTSSSLGKVAQSIRTSTDRTVGELERMEGAAGSQSEAVRQVDEAMGAIVGQAERLGREIDRQNQAVSQSTASIEATVASMGAVHRRIEEAAGHVEELVRLASDNKSVLSVAAQDIVNVRQEATSLQEMNSVISSVAAQTNLLAMNAAIEAAHAGAAGKGFAVVADEIRKLAETTAKQASSSSSYLKSIQGKIDGIAETAVTIDTSFSDTIQRINDISSVVIELEQATGEQEALSATVLKALQEMKDSTRVIASSMDDISLGTAETSRLCRELRSMNDDMNKGLAACKDVSMEMQNASKAIGALSSVSTRSVQGLMDSVGSFRVERADGEAPPPES